MAPPWKFVQPWVCATPAHSAKQARKKTEEVPQMTISTGTLYGSE
jgi:hypothetical protein